MRNFVLGAMIGGALAGSMMVAAPAWANQSDKPITDRDPNAMDIAKTPITDLNVGRDGEIPPLLISAVAKPYALDGLGKCRQLAVAVTELDEVLGPDMDLPQEERDRISGGRVAKWVVASFIPFRGLIREVSGANEQDRKVNAAIQAGLTRRGFLKGVGAAKGCKYPASPAPPQIIEARLRQLEAEGSKPRKDKLAETDAKAPETGKDGLEFKSEPDVRQPPPKP